MPMCGSIGDAAIASGSLAATSSMSMPPCGRRHQHAACRRAVEVHRDVELLGDVGRLLDQHLPHLLPSGPVWWVTSCMPRIFDACSCASSGSSPA
jgi:hypothetical protein